jgi:hypothetical protein
MWNELPFEAFIERRLKSALGGRGTTLWSNYVALRSNLCSQVFPWIQTKEPSLSDHRAEHIQNVIENVTYLLGYPNEHGADAAWQYPADLTIHDLFLILLGCLTHDIGNILGRERHNQKIAEVAALAGPAWFLWDVGDRMMVEAIGRAHTGKSPGGSRDTIEALSTQPAHFVGGKVNTGEVAAIVRFADELAEGPQRTSAILLHQGLIEESSKIFHLYAHITRHHIDYAAGRILITYYIDTCDPLLPTDQSEKRVVLEALLKIAYSRSLKLNAERQYARHYSSALSRYKETSISIVFSESGIPLSIASPTLLISDAKTAFDNSLTIESLCSDFDIPAILSKILPEGGSDGA